MKNKLNLSFFFVIVSMLMGPVLAQGNDKNESGLGRTFLNERIIVKFKGDLDPDVEDDVFAEHKVKKHKFIKELKSYVVLAKSKDDTLDTVAKLKKRKDVEFAEPDMYCEPMGRPLRKFEIPNDPDVGNQYWVSKINLPGAWDINKGSANIIIAILDSGCDPTHPDLIDKYVPGYNFFDNNTNTADIRGHGTAVAGCAAAATNNGIGMAGAGRDCKLMPIRISDSTGYAYWSTLAQALQWAADRGAKVANASFACGESTTVQSAARYMNSKGGVFCCSAGNQATQLTGTNTVEVIMVGATDSADNLASFSNWGTSVDVVAPGVATYTTQMGGTYGYWSGTSFSSPITAGVGALMLSTNSTLKASDVDRILKSTAKDLGDPGPDSKFAYGRIDALAALQIITGSTPPPPPPPAPGAPAVKILYPLPFETVSGNYNFQVSVSNDTLSTITFLSGTVDSLNIVPLKLVSGNTYAGFWGTTNVVNGTHTFTVIAQNSANLTSQASVDFNVNNAVAPPPPPPAPDITAPTISITSPVNGATISRGTVQVKSTSSDDVGVIRVELYVDGRYITNSSTAPFTVNWNARKALLGAHTILLKAKDAAGNTGNSQTITINLIN
jgi:thermitase